MATHDDSMSRSSEDKVKEDELEKSREEELETERISDADPTSHQEKPAKTTKDGSKLIPEPSDDPRDPLNWSMTKKVTIFSVMMFATFVAISTAVANVLATPQQAKTWHTTGTRAAYSVSAVLGGIVVGPFLLVPLVRVFGVMSCCFWSTIFLTVTSVWSAVSTEPDSYGSFVASRFVAGIFAPTTQIFLSGTIVHMFFLHQRGKIFAIYSTVYMIAQLAGPTFSGYIVTYVEWPVVFWWTVGANGLAAVLIFLFCEETAWDRERNKPLARKEIPNGWFARRRALFFFGTAVAPPHAVRTVPQAFKALIFIGVSPVTVLVGIFSTLAYGWYIMAGVQVPLILETPKAMGGYGFGPSATSNFYFCAWIGAFLGVIYGILLNDRLPLWLQKRNNGVWHEEYRLWPSWIPGLIVGPIGYGVFGAAVYYQWHWIVVAVGEAMLVFAAVSSLPPTVNYIIEIWKSCPQEVGAALNVWRLALSVAVQFFYTSLTKKIGINWAWGMASFLALFGFACIVVCMWKGPALRKYDLIPEDYDPNNLSGKAQSDQA